MFITVSFIIADTLKQGIPQYNMDEQTVVRPYYGIVFGTEKEWTMKSWKRHEWNLNAYSLVKETKEKAKYCVIPACDIVWGQWKVVISRK